MRLDDERDVSRETEQMFERYLALLRRWSTGINLVGPDETGRTLRDRHIPEGIWIANHIKLKDVEAVDMGSGAGFPGVVVAIMRPDLRVSLVEADNRKAAFLRAVRRELSLSFDVISERLEALSPVEASVVMARALAPVDRLLDHMARHGRPGAIGLFLKGERWQEEVEAAKVRWDFTYQPHRKDLSRGVLLEISDLLRRTDAA